MSRLRNKRTQIRRSNRVFHHYLGNTRHLLKLNTLDFPSIQKTNIITKPKKIKEKKNSFINKEKETIKERRARKLFHTTSPTPKRVCKKAFPSKQLFSYYFGRGLNDSEFQADKSKTQKLFSHFNLTRNCFKEIGRFPKKGGMNNFPLINTRNKKKTLVLDLDETLIHSFSKPQSTKTNITEVEIETGKEKTRKIYFKKRPGLSNFLKQVSKIFTVYIFTASQRFYADPIIDNIDPTGSLFAGRFYKDSCSLVNGYLVKDLRVFGTSLKDVVIVDNLALSFGLQTSNGVPIVCYKGEENDCELEELSRFLLYLNGFDDIRVPILRHFQWDRLEAFFRGKLPSLRQNGF